jgi:hypothetical protein
MNVRTVLTLYAAIIGPILALYVFLIIFTTSSSVPTPEAHAAIPIVTDLVKIGFGAMIGVLSSYIGANKDRT